MHLHLTEDAEVCKKSGRRSKRAIENKRKQVGWRKKRKRKRKTKKRRNRGHLSLAAGSESMPTMKSEQPAGYKH